MSEQRTNSLSYHITAVKKGERVFENAFQGVSRMILEGEIDKDMVNGKNTFDFRIFRKGPKHIVGMYDVVVLAVDSLPARLVVNEACVSKRVTLVDGGINGLHGTLLTVRPGKTACLHCLYGDVPPPLGAVASFAPVASMVSAMQAQAAANILLGLDNPSDGTMILLDGAQLTTERVRVRRREDCPVCSKLHN